METRQRRFSIAYVVLAAVFGDVSTGAQDDLQRATGIARHMEFEQLTLGSDSHSPRELEGD